MPSDRRPAILFAEDFDVPVGVTVLDDPPESAKPKPPPITQADVTAAQEKAYAEGFENGLAQAAADRAEVTSRMLRVIAERLETADAEARSMAEKCAESVARLLLGTLASMLPATCARHGETEVVAAMRAILPALSHEPRIILRVSPHVVDAVSQELEHMGTEMAEKISLTPTDAVPPGDVRVSWEDGEATRDARALWRDIAETLAPLDLFPVESLPA
jgi:flagellar biosynthesis/type III secretory pathway protein FliH